MKKNTLEPGLLPIFRWFAILRMVILLAGAATVWWVAGFHPLVGSPRFDWINLALAGVLILFLFWTPIQARLGRFFLPIGILLAVSSLEIEQYLNLSSRPLGTPYPPLAGAWQMVPLLMVPLILVSAQYRFRYVIYYSGVTYLTDLVIIYLAVGQVGRELFPTLSVLSLRTISFLLVGYSIVQLMGSQRRQRQELSLANQQIAHYASTLEQLTISRERNRLARELHDTLAHSLSGVAVQLEAVRSLWDENPESAHEMLEQALSATRNGLTETRRALQALRATPIDDLGLALAIRSLVDSFTNRTGLKVNTQIDDNLPSLSANQEQCVYRVAQEALENIRRHAEAHQVSLNLETYNESLRLLISDDGVGFDIEQAGQIENFGLSGMRERTEEAGGELEIISRPGLGTRIQLICGGRV